MKIYRWLLQCFLSLITMLFIEQASAQLCTGSLGDPVVNITFGQGANQGSSLAPGITNYGYMSTSCPDDGFYNIGSSTVNCFGSTWFTVNEDHTPGDTGGLMMIVNASNNPGVFYVDTVKGLCASTTYEFAAWILNVIKPTACNSNSNKPNVTFTIETTSGAILLTSQTGDIPPTGSPVWNQYGAFFSTPSGVSSVVIRMTNNAPGGCGNDLLLDDITFRPCGAQVTTSFIGGESIKDVCIGDNGTYVLNAVVNPSDNSTFYQWQVSTNGTTWNDISGATSVTYTRPPQASTAVNYQYRLAVAQGTNIQLPACRVVSNVVAVNVNAIPVPAASNDGPLCVGDSLTLSAVAAKTYMWTGPGRYTSSSPSPVISNVTDANAGKYYVTVVTDAGCTNNDSTLVLVKPVVIARAGNDVTICEGKSTLLQGVSNGSDIDYTWSPAAGLSSPNSASTMASPVDTTTYIFSASNGGCLNRDTIVVNVLKKPVANAGTDHRIFEGQSAVLNGTVAGTNVSFNWTPTLFISNPLTLNTVVTPPADTTYTLRVTSRDGCGTATDNVFIRVYKKVLIPNVFSPNNDGINDKWHIEALDTYPEAELWVFNRYGQLLHSANGNSLPWDGSYNGSILPVGAYYYVIDLKNGLGKLSGSVMIIR